MPLFVVESISTLRHKYVIECQELEHAFDTVTMGEAAEFSQMFLGEQIITGHGITKETFNEMNDMLTGVGDGTSYQPESGSPWMGDKMINKVKYDTESEL